MAITVKATQPNDQRGNGVCPWGAHRLTPYPATVRLPHASVTVDPVTQLGVFRDRAGHVVEMGKHGTSKGTETSTTTNSDSAPDQGHDQDSTTD
ncbi:MULTISPECIES: putative ATP-grasp-modified RiPP [unclassified Streptomyces]|uniref:putative ATP-grasp-modified RiPP n=1 Tax=unclassified Streptomyces TaxID=2593676 RepID=UPI0033A93595